MKRLSGFTLMEMILVVVIIGILAALVMPRLVGQTDKARMTAAKTQIVSLRSALSQFEANIRRYPSTSEGLKALVEPPPGLPENVKWERCLEERSVPQDPWGKSYVYRQPGAINTDGYDLLSLGPDGQEGTTDDIGTTR